MSLIFVANLALSDTVLPLLASMSTPIMTTADYEADHQERYFKCRVAMGLFISVYLHAFGALVILSTDRFISIHMCLRYIKEN